MEIIDLILCVFYSGIFLIAMQLEKKLKYILPTTKRNQKIQSLSAAQIQQTKEDQFVRNQHKMQLRILLVTSACLLLSWHNYNYKCKNQTLTECFNFPIGYQAFKSTLHAMILNFTVFVGPFYQDYMSSKIKIKFKDMDFNRFRWDEFKRLVMGPVIEEWVFRNLINNLINKDFNNNMIFVFVSGIIYALGKTIYLFEQYFPLSNAFQTNSALDFYVLQNVPSPQLQKIQEEIRALEGCACNRQNYQIKNEFGQ